jgi:endoglucanase
MKHKITCILFFLVATFSWSQLLKVDGKKIVDNHGNEVILKGMGLGGWMLQEGYMMQSSDVADTQHEFRKKLIALIGETKTDEFYNAWLQNHVTKKDIDSLAKWGFNSVRLPMHYNLFTLPIEKEPIAGQQTWLPKGFTMVDDLLSWCKANNMYVILDLHAAPGGQGANAAISDYDITKPSLWESQANKDKTIALWRKIAERYKDEQWVGGYDLLNEVNWTLSGNTALKALYVQITNAIREVDTNHIIYIEGNSFANDFTGLTPPWDPNIVYSFHKYWSFNDKGSIQWVLDMQNQHNIPLWMGEGGENSNVWFTDAIKLLEEHKIGWSWWPMKRVETIVGPYSIKFTDGYKKILNYWRGQGAKPTENEAYNAIMELATNTNSTNCDFQKDVPDAMIRQVTTDQSIPYKKHTIPGIIHMSDFDLGRIGKAYFDKYAANYGQSTGTFQAWNNGWVYRNDGVDIEKSTDAVNSNGYHIGFTNKDEWMNYTVYIAEAGVYKADVRLAALSTGGKFHFQINNQEVTPFQNVTSTGGWTTFSTLIVNDIILSEGKHVLKFYFDSDIEFNLSSLKFTKTGESTTTPLKVLNGHTFDINSVEVVLNQPILQSSVTGSKDQFKLIVNGVEETISSVSFDPTKDRSIKLTTSKTIIYTNDIKVTYNGNVIKSSSGKTLETFTNFPIRNTLETLFVIPGKIETESFIAMVGLGVENTTDTGGGSNIGYTHAGDYADYKIYSDITGNYKVKFRLAAQSNPGKIGLFLVANGVETQLLTIDTPITGGWQTWQTVEGNLNIPKGIHILRMRVLAGGFNFNWMDFSLLNVNEDSDGDGVSDGIDNCPNTVAGAVVDANGCAIFSLPANNFSIRAQGETCQDRKNGKIIITAVKNHNYKLTLNGVVRDFSLGITLSGLSPGTYDFCITVDGQVFEQCYKIIVEQGRKILGKTSISGKTASINIEEGTAPFTAFVNGKKVLETLLNDFNLEVTNGDVISVKSAIECEGVFENKIDLVDTILAYPNPSKGKFEIAIPTNQKEINVEVYNIYGQLVFSKLKNVLQQKLHLDISNLPSGIYIVKINLQSPVQIKLIKE